MFDQILQKEIPSDPSKSSIREEMLDLKFDKIDVASGKSIYLDETTGETFYKIEDESGPNQKLFSLILRGAINVSDIVKVGNNYYSHKQKIDEIEASRENILNEIEADRLIFREIFGDIDHIYFLGRHNHRNLITDNIGKVSYFDFKRGFSINEIIQDCRDFSELEKMFRKHIKEHFDSTLDKSITLTILKNKITILGNLLNNFEIFSKMVQRSGISESILNKEKQEILFKNIKLRLQVLDKVLLELEPSPLETKT